MSPNQSYSSTISTSAPVDDDELCVDRPDSLSDGDIISASFDITPILTDDATMDKDSVITARLVDSVASGYLSNNASSSSPSPSQGTSPASQNSHLDDRSPHVTGHAALDRPMFSTPKHDGGGARAVEELLIITPCQADQLDSSDTNPKSTPDGIGHSGHEALGLASHQFHQDDDDISKSSTTDQSQIPDEQDMDQSEWVLMSHDDVAPGQYGIKGCRRVSTIHYLFHYGQNSQKRLTLD